MSGIRAVLLIFLLRSSSQDASSEYLPPYRPISLKLERVSPRAALKELADRTGWPIHWSDCPERPDISLELIDLPPLQALSAIGRSSLVNWYCRSMPDWRGRVVGGQPAGLQICEAVPYADRPVAVQYIRHYQIKAFVSTLFYDKGKTRDFVHVGVLPAPGLRPHSFSMLRLTEATDLEGRDVLPLLPLLASESFQTCRIGQRTIEYMPFFREKAAAPRALSRLKGRFTLRYPRELRWVSFPRPEEIGPEPVEALGCRFGLQSYERQGRSHDVALSVTRLEGRPFCFRDLGDDLPFDPSEVELVTAGGERLWGSGSSAYGRKKTWTIHCRMVGTKDEAAVEIRLPYVEKFIEDVVEFDLKDLTHE